MNTTENTSRPTLSDLQWTLQAARYEVEDATIAHQSFATEASRRRVIAAQNAYATCKREYDALAEVVAEHNRTHDIATFVFTAHGILVKTPVALSFRNDTGDRDLAIRQAIAAYCESAEHVIDRVGAGTDESQVDFYEMTF